MSTKNGGTSSDYNPEKQDRLNNIAASRVMQVESVNGSKATVTDLERQERRNLKYFPSFENLHMQQLKLVMLIESGNHGAVEEFLKEHGNEVEIVPKLGCPKIHYSKCNIVNFENQLGEGAMLKAAQVDSAMVDIILKYGGNPNQINQDRDCPLSEAARRRDRTAVKSLLRAGANLAASVVKLAHSLRYKSRYCDEEFTVVPLILLCSEDNYIECKDPFLVAFKVCEFMRELKGIRGEFKTEFETIIRRTNEDATSMQRVVGSTNSTRLLT